MAVSLLVMPLFYYFSYTEISKETYKKKFFLVKKGDVDFIVKSDVQTSPILNMDSLKTFVYKSVLPIFNYETEFGLEKINANKKYFSDAGYKVFYPLFNFRLKEEKESGIVIKESLIVDGPYYMGSFSYLNKKAWQFYITVRETTYGLSGKSTDSNRNVFLVISEGDFKKNKKGLSVDSLEIR